MKTFVVAVGQETQVSYVRLRKVDPDHGRETATVKMTASVEEAKTLFAGAESWETVIRDDDGNEVKTQDCGQYEKLLAVHDHIDGTVSVVLGKATAAELLDVLMGGE